EYPLNAAKPVLRAPRIVIESFRGNARIVGNDVNEVRVTGHKTVRSLDQNSANNADRDTPFEIVGDENRVVIRTNQDRVRPDQRFSEDLEMSVPKGASIEAHGRYGDFDISNVDGLIDINSDNAGVRLEKIGGEVRLDLRRSDVIRAVGVKGAIDIKGRGGDIDLENVDGGVTINGSYSGLAEFHALAKPGRFTNSYSEFQAERVTGEARVGIGDISGSNLVGPVRITAMRNKDVRLVDVSNSLEIALERGDIQITAAALPVAKIDARTRTGDVLL